MEFAPNLEDGPGDVVSKAMRGLVLTDKMVSERSGLTLSQVVDLRNGLWDEFGARKIAPVLGLDADGLVGLAQKSLVPPPIELPQWAPFSTAFEDMSVNSYLGWDSTSREAIAFDTGSDCSGVLEMIRSEGLVLKAIFLTHTHGDHIFDLDRLREATGALAFVNEREALDGAESFVAGRSWRFGRLQVDTRFTWGHSRGGTTYVISGLSLPVAVVGDALFAGSMGGGGVSYRDAIRTNRSEIFTLARETVLCPGHGPMTTVDWELRHNPFFGPSALSL
ncbi:MAG: Zn-dependent hydrolase, glyoxylase family [Verrucomicrobiota bacterium]|jgi:glyoxylase-like metal-dependent hydrolase (beta-lactamase superfamily II)